VIPYGAMPHPADPSSSSQVPPAIVSTGAYRALRDWQDIVSQLHDEPGSEKLEIEANTANDAALGFFNILIATLQHVPVIPLPSAVAIRNFTLGNLNNFDVSMYVHIRMHS
jgi:hypothetical protein